MSLLKPPTPGAEEVFAVILEDDPYADMRAVPNQWVLNERARTGEVAADLEEKITQLRTLLSATVELAEYWIEQGREPHMSKARYDLWLATGHRSPTLLRAKAATTGKEVPKC